MRLRLSAVVSAVLFTIGYSIGLLIPGGGSGVTEQDFTDFYDSDGKKLVALFMGLALTAAALALVWFFDEARSRLADGALGRVGYTAAVIGASAAAIGGWIQFGPAAVQVFDADVPFVGVAIARSLSQAGASVMIGLGMMSLALTTALFSLGARRAGLLPSWAGPAGVVAAVLIVGSIIYLPGFIFPLWVLAFGLLLRPKPLAA